MPVALSVFVILLVTAPGLVAEPPALSEPVLAFQEQSPENLR